MADYTSIIPAALGIPASSILLQSFMPISIMPNYANQPTNQSAVWPAKHYTEKCLQIQMITRHKCGYAFAPFCMIMHPTTQLTLLHWQILHSMLKISLSTS